MESQIRKRNIGSDTHSNQEDEKNVGDNMCLAEQKSLLKLLLALDIHLTKRLGVCTDKSKSLGSLRPAMKLLEYSCHGIPWLIVNVIAIYCYKEAATLGKLVNLFYALIFDLLVVASIKVCFRRARPAHNKMDMFATVSIDNYSFPSGHATRAAMVAFFFIRNFHLTLLLKYFIIIWAGCVAFSRILLGRHHVSDVMFGLLIGYFQYKFVTVYFIPVPTCMTIVNTITHMI